MVFHTVLLKLAEWVVYQLLANSCYRAARKVQSCGCFFLRIRNPSPKSSGNKVGTLACDFQGALLRSSSFFPYFMLVAFEAGSILRALVLLLSYPALWFLDSDLQLKVMIFITFRGLRVKDMESAARAVLPKFYLENLHFQAYQVVASSGSAVVFTSVPRVMVDLFLKEYLGVEDVVGTELVQVSRGKNGGNYFTGFVSGRFQQDAKGQISQTLGLPRRQAGFPPNPGGHPGNVPLAAHRDIPRLLPPLRRNPPPLQNRPAPRHDERRKVTYSLSKMSEVIAPIRTVRLTRERERDGETMQRMLAEGDLVVCPEGTTCREPYLLRFSSLFAELSDEIVPVAVNTTVGMFYGTTASGLKCLDPIFFLMNPRPRYSVRILEKLPAAMTCGGGGKSSLEVANYIQRQLGGVLGFECTSLTRRDKYLMLAGNEGIVDSSPPTSTKH
ncbi:unnamed protein product [Linum tenue]|uniref:Glycerol-3-phosphate acyltransferase RAM2/GPAT1-8 HAD-like domain-containing protein n=1 Tax=Linum tenue TaxID=586396 RepID=A0AAV0NSJ0_9ROSI|nr:unnamed protein product [Linum tenue]